MFFFDKCITFLILLESSNKEQRQFKVHSQFLFHNFFCNTNSCFIYIPLVRKLARHYACGTPRPSDLLKKRKKNRGVRGENFLYFYMYYTPFLCILPIFMYDTCFFYIYNTCLCKKNWYVHVNINWIE